MCRHLRWFRFMCRIFLVGLVRLQSIVVRARCGGKVSGAGRGKTIGGRKLNPGTRHTSTLSPQFSWLHSENTSTHVATYWWVMAVSNSFGLYVASLAGKVANSIREGAGFDKVNSIYDRSEEN
jgi:hypothetical protein